ncbi:MAG: hypothetical protein AAGI17_04870 [Planctomycetota bacterium]
MAVSRFGTRLLTAAALAMLAVAGSPAAAQSTDDWRTRQAGEAFDDSAIEVLERHLEAIGGAEAVLAHEKVLRRGSFTGAPFQFKARLEMWQAAPDQQKLVINEPGGLTVTLGFDGTTAWQDTTISDPVKLEGLAALAMNEDSIMHRPAKFRDLYARLTDQGIVENESGDIRLHAIAATPVGSPRDRVMYFDPETGLLQQVRIGTVGPEGNVVQLDIFYEDYKEFVGVKYATKITQKYLGRDPHARYEYISIVPDPSNWTDIVAPAELTGG